MKNSTMVSVRFGLLLCIFLSALVQNVQAQCSAEISSGSLSVCSGSDVNIPVTLNGIAPFTVIYQVNGVPLPPVTAPSVDFDLLIPNVQQTMVVQLTGVTDATGCQGVGSGTVLIEVFPVITSTANITHPTCATDNDGIIQVTPVSGSGPFTYSWSTGQNNTATLSGLSVGPYTVTVSDANGCTQAFPYNLSYQLPIFQVEVTPAACAAANGVIDIQWLTPFSFNAWSNGASTEDLTNIPAGTYTVVVTNSTNGCTRTEDILVFESVPAVMSITNTPANCNGQGGGALSVIVAGGTFPYTFLWSNGATTQGITNIAAGTYTVTVTDAMGCTASVFSTVTATGSLNLAATVQHPTCNGPDGAIDLNVTSGTAPYQFAWSNSATSEDIAGIGTGTYTVTVTDNAGCTRSLSRTLQPFSVTSTATLVYCLNNIHLTVTGGTPPYMYQWSSGQTTQDVTGMAGGTYSVTVTDALGCSNVALASGINPPAPVATIFENTSACSGGLVAQMTGVQPNNTLFLWSTGATTRLLSNIPAGTYTVTVTGILSGCTASATITTSQSFANSFLTVDIEQLPMSCAGANDGSLIGSATGAFPPFTFQWSNGSTTQVISNLPAGLYTVTVTDANGCTAVRAQNLLQPSPVVATWQVTNSTCNGASGSIFSVASGGTAPYTYQWKRLNDNMIWTTPIGTNLPGGSYQLTVTDANGCTYISPVIAVGPLPFPVFIEVLSASCNSATLSATNGIPGNFQYAWTGPAGYTSHFQNITVYTSGVYTVISTDQFGCTFQASYTVNISDSGSCGAISGRLLRDENQNCLTDPGEPGLGGWLVRAESATDTLYGVSNVDGNFWVHVLPGTYTMSAIMPNGLWQPCPVGPAVTVSLPDDTVATADLLVKPAYECPSLNVVIGTGLLRRCFNNNNYFITYCNEGTAPATDAYIIVTLDPFLTAVSAGMPYTNLGGGILRFDVGNVAIGECNTFHLRVAVSCNAVLGQTHCTEAHIYPDFNCLPPNASWSGASLRVTSQCSSDSVRFTIKNIGLFDMQSASNYIVVEDAVMLMRSGFQLGAGDSTIVALQTNGSTWRVEVDQVEFHPGLSSPGLSVEGCSNTPSFSTGFVTQFPNNDADPWIDIDCTANVGAIDPNDKQGFPVGYGQEHYIRPGTELEYLIRFQNTGTDTAFTVRIADTLSPWLDPATIRPGVSSHSYQFNLTGPGIAEFLFENILLPDSNVNQEASNGFVKFSIYPKADAPLETLIENTAHIYFDFNEAVVTNTTRHRLGENFMLVGAWQPQLPEYEVLVSPNPFGETALLEVKGLTSSQPIHLQVIDLQGNIVHDETAQGPVLTIRKGQLNAGMYLFKLDHKGLLLGTGKLIIRD